MLQKFMERVGFGDVFFEKASVGLVADFGEQRGDGRLDVAHEPQINGCSPSNVFRVSVDLDFPDVVARKKFRERKVGAEQQHQIRVVNRLIGSAVAEKPGHSDGMGIVMLQPLLPAKGIATGAFSLAASCSTSSRASRQPSPPKIVTFFAASIISASLSRSASAGRNTGGAGIVTRSEEHTAELQS